MNLCTLSRSTRRVATAAALFAFAAAAVAAPAPSAPTPQSLDAPFGAARANPVRCAPPPAGAPSGREGAPGAATDGGAERLALGGTHCWWACYPGSGCEYVCRFYPQ